MIPVDEGRRPANPEVSSVCPTKEAFLVLREQGVATKRILTAALVEACGALGHATGDISSTRHSCQCRVVTRIRKGRGYDIQLKS